APTAPRTSADIQESILAKLAPAKASIVRVLIELHPGSIGREDLAERVKASAASSAFQHNLGSLRSLGVIEYAPDRSVFAQAVLRGAVASAEADGAVASAEADGAVARAEADGGRAIPFEEYVRLCDAVTLEDIAEAARWAAAHRIEAGKIGNATRRYDQSSWD